MFDLPDFERSFEYENAFWLSCAPNRLSKALAHYELYRRTLDLAGEIVECGIFKGASLARFAMMREMLGSPHQKRIVGFDVFGPFPETSFEADRPFVERWTAEAGDEGISRDDLMTALRHKGCDRNVELVAGDIRETLPAYVKEHPELRVSLLNLDTDVYEPARVALEQLWPRVVPGGIVLLDDYGVFPGETQAADEYFADAPVRILKLPFCKTPSFVVKE